MENCHALYKHLNRLVTDHKETNNLILYPTI